MLAEREPYDATGRGYWRWFAGKPSKWHHVDRLGRALCGRWLYLGKTTGEAPRCAKCEQRVQVHLEGIADVARWRRERQEAKRQ